MLRLVPKAATRLGIGLAYTPNFRRDIAIASFPRSGNTWVRSVIYELETGAPPKALSDIDFVVPDVHITTPRWKLRRAERYVVKTHDPLRIRHRYARAVYVIRDVRPSLASYHRYLQKSVNLKAPMETFFVDALIGRYWPCSWYEHVTSWTASPCADGLDVSVIRYEDLVGGSRGAFETLLTGLGHNDKFERIPSLIERHSMEQMKRRESAGNRPNLSKETGWFIGGGESDCVDAEDLTRLIERHAPHYMPVLERFGYLDA
jgi:hypothetical protein